MEMMENPDGFTTFPQPPLTPFFPSDFLPFRENIFEILGIRYKGPLPLTGRLDYQNFFWENF